MNSRLHSKQVAEKEIICLTQSLDDERAKSDRLEKELACFKSSFLCENIVSTDKIVTKEVGCRGNVLDGPAELDHQSVDSHEVRKKQFLGTLFWSYIVSDIGCYFLLTAFLAHFY